MQPTKLKTFLWFNGGLDEALAFYARVLGEENLVVLSENRMGAGQPLFTAEFNIFGQEFIGMNWQGGPEFNDSISLSLNVDGQDEVDRLWTAFTERGEAGRCGWLKDEWGLSWQVTPIQMGHHLSNPDPAKAAYAMSAMRAMGKIIIRDLYE
jgi:predicted 3-demethylubiquinone-9 3-methyltransferase (glyoxalase superfamily)